MSSQTPSPTFESRDTILLEFKDTELARDLPSEKLQDEFVRHYVSMYFVNDLKPDPGRRDLEHLLALAREREQFCRGANDHFGLARCLGNQALIQNARGQTEEALTLLRQLEPLSRQLEDVEGLAFALIHQAALLDNALGQTAAALPLAEQAQRLATEHHLSQLGNYIEPLLTHLRAKVQGNG